MDAGQLFRGLTLSKGHIMSSFTFKKTSRGFGLIHMPGRQGEVFSLQESSAIDSEQAIWFGPSELRVQSFQPGGWRDVDFNALIPGATILGNERMHLTQSQVRDIIPILSYFVREGALPDSLSDLYAGHETGSNHGDDVGSTPKERTEDFTFGRQHFEPKRESDKSPWDSQVHEVRS